jgi:hypothetical protein
MRFSLVLRRGENQGQTFFCVPHGLGCLVAFAARYELPRCRCHAAAAMPPPRCCLHHHAEAKLLPLLRCCRDARHAAAAATTAAATAAAEHTPEKLNCELIVKPEEVQLIDWEFDV